jgi:hypothetical protein
VKAIIMRRLSTPREVIERHGSKTLCHLVLASLCIGVAWGGVLCIEWLRSIRQAMGPQVSNGSDARELISRSKLLDMPSTGSNWYAMEAGFAGDHSLYCSFDCPIDEGWHILKRYLEVPRQKFGRWIGQTTFPFILQGPGYVGSEFQSTDWEIPRGAFYYESKEIAGVMRFGAIDVKTGRVYVCFWSGGPG